MAQPIDAEAAAEVARIDDLAERERSACPSTDTLQSYKSTGARILPAKPKPGALRVLFAQDVASDWWLEAQLMFGGFPNPRFETKC